MTSSPDCRLEPVSGHPTGAPSSGVEHRFPTRLRWALVIVLLFHGSLLAFGSHRGTYDAFVHMFFGYHYARDWFSTWDQRWYTGFTTVSYPPGTHQALALVSKLTGGLDSAFVVVQLLSLLFLTIGVFRFSRLWVNDAAAANAALLLATSSAIAQTVHLYGQLPTTFALAFLLNALPSIYRWVFAGRLVDLLIGTVTLAACTAGHHVTTLFGSVFFLGPLLVAGLLRQSRTPRSDEVSSGDHTISRQTLPPLAARRLRRVLPSVLRGAVLGPCLLAALVIVVLPYWIWTGSDPITQIPIPHGSRANFLADRNIGLIFFVIPWGVMLPLLPYALARAVLDRMWPLAASIFLLFVLGTGGTTPIPRLLLGGAFDILTLDRFTFWASIQILPVAGLFVASLETGSIAAWFRRTGGERLVRMAQASFVLMLLAVALFSATLARLRPFQPDPISTDPIVAFIEKDQHERWRFLTLGFGDQMAWLSAQTTATQVDGNYHSVRRLPELTSTSVERLEGAKYRGVAGLGSLQQFLEVPEKYHLKYVFSNDAFYDPLLHFLGWQRLGPLENGIVVWEKADIEPLPAELPVREVPPWQRFLWGTLPPAMILMAILLQVWTAAGRPGLGSGRPDADTAVLRGPLRALDNGLLQREQRLTSLTAPTSPAGANKRGDPTEFLDRVRMRLGRDVGPRRKLGRTIALITVFGALPLHTVLSTSADAEPEEIVEAYFDHLDFRQWEDAYELLDPDTRPDYELWRLQISVDGGILASYAKLDSIATEVVDREGANAVVRADLRYLTALDWYPVERDLHLVVRDGVWRLSPEPVDLIQPPDQLVRRPAVDFSIQGRRRVTSLASQLTDIQDRPELAILGVRVVEQNGLPVVVGEVTNLDVDPADVTLTAVLRNNAGEVVARYNATDHLIRTLNPRESTAFRIEFQQVAAGNNVDFDPLHVSPIELNDDIVTAEIYAKAVVTENGLYRGLQVNDLRLEANEDGTWRLDGDLRNDGVLEAVIPMVLVSFLEEDGTVGWVERFYLSTSIRSQRTGSFSYDLPPLDGLTLAPIEVRNFANAIGASNESLVPLTGIVGAPPGSPFHSIRIDLFTMLPPGEIE